MDSAYVLFQEAGDTPLDPSPSQERKWTLRDRKRISAYILDQYRKTRPRENRTETEYIWLDEFCLSAREVEDETIVQNQRSNEIARIADIFRGAAKVYIFCHVPDCDHTKPDCPWGKRLFTLGEIIHAVEVIRMIRKKVNGQGEHLTSMHPLEARLFKGDMQAEAAKAKRWHLYSIMQDANNPGGVTWSTAIPALVIEAIHRDEASGFNDHRFLGKALNGLLPRKARVDDLKGKDGWEDLAWLLELNQGFFNAAGLAAVCSVAEFDAPSYRWLGKPIPPTEGNERLEPLVKALPVSMEQYNGSRHHALYVVGPKTIPLTSWLNRDPYAL
ncbi:hypothetical protein M422DRAFT_165064, partial [Sphaerobolus stellatus SS14]